MGRWQRLKTKITSVFRHISFSRPEAVVVTEGYGGDEEEGGVKQYRLEATRKVSRSLTCVIRIFFASLTFVNKK
jgi:hypothetical protein